MHRVQFLYDGPHPIHLAWAKSVGAEPIENVLKMRTDAAAVAHMTEKEKEKVGIIDFIKKITTSVIGVPTLMATQGAVQYIMLRKKINCDVLLCEGRLGFFPTYYMKMKKNIKTSIILADPLVNEYRNFGDIWKIRFEKVFSTFDALFCVSELMKNLLPEKCRKNSYIVHPSYDMKYLNINCDSSSHNIIYLGAIDKRKGVDIAIESFSKVKKAVKDSQFYLIGHGPLIKKFKGEEGVKFLGFVEDPSIYFKKSSICFHMARFDPYPVSVLEMMASGIVPIVSEMTGTKEILKYIDEKLIAQSADAAAKKAIELFNNPEYLRELSEKCRKIVFNETKEKSVENFRKAFEEAFG